MFLLPTLLRIDQTALTNVVIARPTSPPSPIVTFER